MMLVLSSKALACLLCQVQASGLTASMARGIRL